jgi:hypothetical protein
MAVDVLFIAMPKALLFGSDLAVWNQHLVTKKKRSITDGIPMIPAEKLAPRLPKNPVSVDLDNR